MNPSLPLPDSHGIPLISVIVVTFNQQDSLSATLDSILEQKTDFDFEIIVGDDASSDNTPAVCNDYASRFPGKIRVIRRDANVGVTANYFDCIRQARGRFLADCAGDDRWCDPAKLQRQADFLLQNPDFSMVTTDWLCTSPDSLKTWRHDKRPEIRETEVWQQKALFVPVLNHTLFPHLCSALYRRDVVVASMEKSPDMMHRNNWQNEDIQIFLACSAAGKVASIPGISLLYTCGDDSVSKPARIPRRFSYSLSTLCQILSLATHYGVERNDLSEWISSTCNYLWALAFHSGDRNLRNQILLLMTSLGLPFSPKACLYRLATSSDILWKLLSKIHKP